MVEDVTEGPSTKHGIESVVVASWMDLASGAVSGARTHIRTLVEALRDRKIGAELVHSRSFGFFEKLGAWLGSLGSKESAFNSLYRKRTERLQERIQTTAGKHGAQLIHSHDPAAQAAAQTSGKPTVITVHTIMSREARMAGWEGDLPEYWEEMERRAFSGADLIVAVDSGHREYVAEDYGVERDEIRVVRNAVDTERFSPGEAEYETEYLLCPRRLEPKNGVEVAVTAFAELPPGDTELWLAGGGRRHAELVELAEDLGVEDRVRFLGQVPHEMMVNLLRGSCGVIVPSVPSEGVIEATSIAALEGMSVARPVLASRLGGLAEIITDGETGLLFPPGEARELADRIERILGDPEFAGKLGRAAREEVIEHYSREVWLDQVLDCYHEALERHG